MKKTDKIIAEFGEDAIKENWQSSNSGTEFLKTLGINYQNGSTGRFLKECSTRFDLPEFERVYKRKYPLIKKECPVCGKIFQTSKGHKGEKSTCSHACSNTYFRSGQDNGMYQGSYRTECFMHHEKKCIVCGEDKIVSVHHNDHDHSNNDPENLIPLCPTHHQYVHSRYVDEVQPIIDEYISSRGVA